MTLLLPRNPVTRKPVVKLNFKFLNNAVCITSSFSFPLFGGKVVYFLFFCACLQGALFWDYPGIGLLGIDGIRVLLGVIPFSE